MKLSELLKTIQPVQVTGSTEKDITGVNIDSRLVAAGHLFMAMRGTQTDGHAYIPAAIEKGAIAVLCEDMPEEPTPNITYKRQRKCSWQGCYRFLRRSHLQNGVGGRDRHQW